MVGPVRWKAPVRSQTQTSPPPAEAIIESSRRRTGSPSALNIGANLVACAGSIGPCAIGAPSAAKAAVSPVDFLSIGPASRRTARRFPHAGQSCSATGTFRRPRHLRSPNKPRRPYIYNLEAGTAPTARSERVNRSVIGAVPVAAGADRDLQRDGQ